MSLTVRRFRLDEAAEFRAIRLEALAYAPEAFTDAFDDAVALEEAVFAERLAAGPVWGAFSPQRCLGMAGMDRGKEANVRHKAFVWGVYVAEAARGQSLGERLLGAIVEHAHREGVTLLQLGVGEGNWPARRLYTRMGFLPYGLEQRALRLNGYYIDEVLMALKL
jgi:ribosomal protein S18 acetylase RimI-like enzyme